MGSIKEIKMKQIYGYILYVFLFLSLAAGCTDKGDWVNYRGKDGSGYTPTTIYPPLGIKWKLKLQNSGEQINAFNPPVVRDNDIYFGSTDGNFYSLDMESGYMNWIFKTNQKVNSAPYADDERVYFGSNDGRVYAVDRKTGKKVWDFYTGNTVQSLVLRWEDRIIFTSDTGATFFLDLDGHEVNRVPNPVWSHHTFQVYDGVVYWAPYGRNFGAWDIRKRRYLWTVNVSVPYEVWFSFPAIDEKQVYFSRSVVLGNTGDLRFFALDRNDGSINWSLPDVMDMGDRIYADRYSMFYKHINLLDYLAPSLWKDLVIYTSGDTIVRAINKNTGEIVWKRQFPYPTSSAPTVAGDRIYFGISGSDQKRFTGDSAKLVCLSARDGSILWEMDTDGAILAAPVIAGNHIIFGTENHLFYVLEELF